MNQIALPGMPIATTDGDRDCWATPRDLFERLDAEFGFVWDLAAEVWSAKCDCYFTRDQDALAQRWRNINGSLFCNPPFSELKEWAAKARYEAAQGAVVVMLLPAHRCEQPWFQGHVIGHAHEVRMIRRRVAYDPPPGLETGADGAKFPSMVVVWRGPNPDGITELRGL